MLCLQLLSHRGSNKKTLQAKFKMMRAAGLQILEEDRQRCRATLRTFNLTENVSTVLQSIHFAAPSRRLIAATPRHRRSGAAAARRVVVEN